MSVDAASKGFLVLPRRICPVRALRRTTSDTGTQDLHITIQIKTSHTRGTVRAVGIFAEFAAAAAFGGRTGACVLTFRNLHSKCWQRGGCLDCLGVVSQGLYVCRSLFSQKGRASCAGSHGGFTGAYQGGAEQGPQEGVLPRVIQPVACDTHVMGLELLSMFLIVRMPTCMWCRC